MKALESLFGQSPFTHLQRHMEQVSKCVHAAYQLITSLPQPLDFIETKAKEISDLEHIADLAKAHIKKNLSKAVFLPVNRDMLLQALNFQDSLADTCEKLAHLLSYYPLDPNRDFAQAFSIYSEACFETFEHARRLVDEYDALVSTSFGGNEAERVDMMVEQVAISQHNSRLKEYQLMRMLYAKSSEMPYAQFHLWHTVFRQLGRLAFQSEKLVYRMRRMLESR